MATIMLAEILLLFVVGACAIKTHIDISQNEIYSLSGQYLLWLASPSDNSPLLTL